MFLGPLETLKALISQVFRAEKPQAQSLPEAESPKRAAMISPAETQLTLSCLATSVQVRLELKAISTTQFLMRVALKLFEGPFA